VKRPVGYLVNYHDGLSGERGLYYNYILGSNGIFIEAASTLLAARIQAADGEVRGLAPVETNITLALGRIPQHFFDLALDTFLVEPDKEHYVAVTGSAGYHFYVPVQDNNGGSVIYEVGEAVVLDLHSHGYMKAFFSGQDDRDENGLKLYGVVGRLNATPVVKLRIGVYGYFKTLAWGDIFDGSLTGAVENEEEEVIAEGDLHCDKEPHAPRLQHFSRWLRWNRWFCL